MLARIKWKLRQFRYNLVRSINWPAKNKTLLIARFDAVGDFILFYNCLKAIKEDPHWGQYRLVFVGNVAYKEFVSNYCAALISDSVWISPSLLNDSFNKDYLIFLWKIKLKRPAVIIHPTHSRTTELDRFIMDVKAPTVIVSEGDDIRQSKNELEKTNSAYTTIIQIPDHTSFELNRNIVFTQRLLGNTKEIHFDLPYVKDVVQSERIVVFPGAGVAFRRWSPEHFVQLILEIEARWPNRYVFILTGSVQERPICDSISSRLPNVKTENRAGETTLVELLTLIGNSVLLISNETSAVHLAAGTKTSFICISNGNHFGRFNPYPKNIFRSSVTVYPDERFYKDEMRAEMIEQTKYISEIDINTISVNEVIKRADGLLKEIANGFEK